MTHDPQPMPSHLAALRDEVMAQNGPARPSIPLGFLAACVYRALAEKRSQVEVRAAFLREQVIAGALDVGTGWTLAGHHLPLQARQTSFDPADAETRASLVAQGVSAEEHAALAGVIDDWLGRGKTLSWAIGAPPEDIAVGAVGWPGYDRPGAFIANGAMENHSIRDYAKLLRTGFSGLRAEVEAARDACDITDPEAPHRFTFWAAALDICAAGELLGRRWAEAAAAAADAAHDPDERARLLLMAETCARVPVHGARTFREAVQALLFGHYLTCGEDHINANGLGRLDQILWPYYRDDLAAGRLTREYAVELMCEFALKLYQNYDVQAILLGGVDADGNDAANGLSEVLLEATERVGFVRDVSLRLHAGTPDSLLRHAARMVTRGGGIPFFFNDDCFIPALTAHGVSLADARNYAYIGCIELTIPGRCNPRAVSGWFNAAKALELALFDGVDPRADVRLGPATGLLTDHATFDDLYAAYAQQVETLAARMAFLCNRGELWQREHRPLPLWSLLTDDCIARGRDITDGGAFYDFHSIALVGIPDVADALAAVRRLVYEEGRIAPGDLLDALRSDFAGHEDLRQLLLRGAPKYGNDDPEVDALAARVGEDFITVLDRLSTPSGGRYVAHLFSFTLHLPFGRAVGATPDGRRAGEPLAYSITAHQGRDVRGATALLRSISRLPHARAGGATAAIIELDPVAVQGEEGIERLVSLLRAAQTMGVGQLQINVTTAERLLQAKEDPERYGNIPVRVSGYSQLFRLVPPDLQDHIIARTKHRG